MDSVGDKSQIEFLRREYEFLLNLKDTALLSYQRLKSERRECGFALNTLNNITRELCDVDYRRTAIILGIKAMPDDANRAFVPELLDSKTKSQERLNQKIWKQEKQIVTLKESQIELRGELNEYKRKHVDMSNVFRYANRKLRNAGLSPIRSKRAHPI